MVNEETYIYIYIYNVLLQENSAETATTNELEVIQLGVVWIAEPSIFKGRHHNPLP